MEKPNFEVTVKGKTYTGILIKDRLAAKPAGNFTYDIRHSDRSSSKPATLEPHVRVNYYGTFVTDSEIPMEVDGGGDKYVNISKCKHI